MPPQPKPWISEIHAYVPGKSAGSDGRPAIKLSANENPLGTSPAALGARAEALAPHRYPDPDSKALRAAIGALHAIDPTRIVMGTGSDELLHLAAQGYAGRGDEVIYVRYGFSVYDIAARRCGAMPIIAPDSDYGSDVDALLALASERTRVVFIANPNNPTGSFLPRGEIARLHAALPADTLLVIDQAYAEYVAAEDDDGALTLAAAHDNVLVTRTFSKIYGLAGERIGWATGAPALIDTLNRIRGPFNTNGPAIEAGIAAMEDAAHVEASIAHNEHWLAWLSAEIGRLGIDVVPSAANFLLLRFPAAPGRTAADADAFLTRHGLVLRAVGAYGLPDCLRLSVGEEASNRLVVATLQAFMEPHGDR